MKVSELSHRLQELRHHAFVYSLSGLAQSLAGLLILPLLTNRLSTEHFGVYSLMQMVVVLTQATFYLGITSALPRFYFEQKEKSYRDGVLTSSFYLSCSGALLLVGLGYLTKSYVSKALLGTDAYATEVFFAELTSALMILNQFFLTYLRLKQASLPVVAASVITLVGQLGLTWLLVFRFSLDLKGALIAAAAAQALLLPLLFWPARHELNGSFMKKETVEILQFGIPTILLGLAISLIEWNDRYIIGHKLSLREVGVYSLSYRLCSVINVLLITPFTMVWTPMVMEHRQSPDIKQLFQKVFGLYVDIGTLILIAGTFSALFVFTRLIYKPEYAEAFVIIPIVMGGTLVYGLTNITSIGFHYSRKLIPLVLIYYSIAILRFALNWFIVPVGGYVGAAWVSLACHLLLTAAVYWGAARSFHVSYPWLKTATLFGYSLGCALLIARPIDGNSNAGWLLKAGLTILAMAPLFIPHLRRNAKLFSLPRLIGIERGNPS